DGPCRGSFPSAASRARPRGWPGRRGSCATCLAGGDQLGDQRTDRRIVGACQSCSVDCFDFVGWPAATTSRKADGRRQQPFTHLAPRLNATLPLPSSYVAVRKPRRANSVFHHVASSFTDPRHCESLGTR